jgi:nitroreductase
MINALEAIAARKSIRAYEDRPIPAKLLTRIIEAGQWAPNASSKVIIRGLQLLPAAFPFQISVVLNGDLRQRINDRIMEAMNHSSNVFVRQRTALPGFQPLYGAPVLVVLSAPDEGIYGAVNVALVAENMLIAATTLGLGSCYLVSPIFALAGEGNKDLATEVGVPENYVVQCGVILGYAAAENKFSPGKRTKRGKVNIVE